MGKRQVAISRTYADDLPLVAIDEDKMAQVYMNILLNAVQAIDGEGAVKIATAYDRGSDTVRIAITDTGAGIAPTHLEKFSTPSLRPKGPGRNGARPCGQLRIVKEHDGDILVDSHPGQAVSSPSCCPPTMGPNREVRREGLHFGGG